MCVTPEVFGASEPEECGDLIEVDFEEELEKIARAVIECSSSELTISGNGGELPKVPLEADAGCEIRENDYGKVNLKINTDDPVNGISWLVKPDSDCAEAQEGPSKIGWDGKDGACPFSFETSKEIENGNYKVKDANHKIFLEVEIPSVTEESIICELEDSAIWDCVLNANMDFKKRANPWAWLIALAASVLLFCLRIVFGTSLCGG